MDVLRKELNLIYESQHLEKENLDSTLIEKAKREARILADIGLGCAVITDASCDRCYIFSNTLCALLGLTDRVKSESQSDSSDEDEIYMRMHPEDLVEKRMLEYEFFKFVNTLPPEKKMSCKATCCIRIKDRNGEYRYINNSTQLVQLSPSGMMWLILCCYNLSPVKTTGSGIEPRIINCLSGEITPLSFYDRRNTILSQREKEIMLLIQEGKLSKQIAAELGISINTVNRHRQNIIEKLSVSNSIEAITAAKAMNLL
ncbi:MAG: LuxR C-terminal-related transcriptional regulator [Muribaculaceae bacterium]|nr:LuxR C-terminal-related transcriptional regulator [Muribaculaceae bacterium]